MNTRTLPPTSSLGGTTHIGTTCRYTHVLASSLLYATRVFALAARHVLKLLVVL
jgi:hypothetical protein